MGRHADWKSPTDSDTRITKMKDGSTHLAHCTEQAVAMKTGAIIARTIQDASAALNMKRYTPLLFLLWACIGAPPPSMMGTTSLLQQGAPVTDIDTVVDELGLAFELLTEDCGVGRIASLTPLPEGGLLICGERGAVRRTSAGSFQGRVEFGQGQTSAVPIWLDDAKAPGSGNPPHFADLGGGWSSVDLLDPGGTTLWTRPGPAGTASANCLASGDLDGDGQVEFVIGYNGAGGLELVDQNGRTLWRRRATNVFSAAIADLDGNGARELVHSSGHQGLLVRDAGGALLWSMPKHDGHFTLLKWPALGAGQLLGTVRRGRHLEILDHRGEPLYACTLPANGHSLSQALPMGSNLLLTRTLHATGKRSELLILSAAGDLLHHSLVSTSKVTVALPNDQATSFLVGAGTSLWLAPSGRDLD
ncbi:MAG: hypothetical protein CMJ87_04005 [Planctomycetes bacterium]|nr:hypothetical protein [Planctomycetota bacterium]